MSNGEFKSLVRWGFVAAILAAIATTVTLTIINKAPHESIIKQRAELKQFRIDMTEDLDSMRLLLLDCVKEKCEEAISKPREFHYMEKRSVGPNQEIQ